MLTWKSVLSIFTPFDLQVKQDTLNIREVTPSIINIFFEKNESIVNAFLYLKQNKT